MAEMTGPQESALYQTPTKERIRELVGRLRGTGGLPLTPGYAKSTMSWMQMMAKRGYLNVDFLEDHERVKATLTTAFPNSSSRSQFCGVILLYFSALTDEEFAEEYPGLTRRDAVDTVRAVASRANKDINNKVKGVIQPT